MNKHQKTIDYLRNQGRFGDTDLVHVNPQEKAMLKAMGGSGTINPNTGLEEYFLGGFFSNPVKAITNAVSDLGSSVDDLVNMSKNHVLVYRLPFGKYAKKRIEEIAIKDPSYLHWMLDSMMELEEDLRYSIDYFLRKIS